jgi:hypothetical protein
MFGAVVVQTRPVSASTIDKLVAEATNPESVQRCSTAHDVRYCVYPGFESLVPAVRSPVDSVIAQLPSTPTTPLIVRQALSIYASGTSLTAGHRTPQIAQWSTELLTAPQNTPTTSTLYVPVGNWPAGSKLAAARFDVALDTAAWAVGLPAAIAAPLAPTDPATTPAQCVAVSQAREAVAIYLALQATHPTVGPVDRHHFTAFVVGGQAIIAWDYPGGRTASYVFPTGLALTDEGYLLAQAMTKLPAAEVNAVLRTSWAKWLDPHTTDTQLASALGIAVPAASSGPAFVPPPGPGAPPQNTVCR